MNRTISAFVLTLLGSCITTPPLCFALIPPVDIHGIYVDSNALPISPADSTALVAALNGPGVDGLVLVLGWNLLEPGRGKFHWNSMDEWMKIAIAAGRKVELSIRADYHTPAWLFQPAPGGGGAYPLYFSFTRKPTDTTCLSETIAAPWDTAFIAQWGLMLDSVSAHLKSTGTYDAVVLLRLTGINKDSDELHLPNEKSSGAACASDVMTTWELAGFRPSLLLRGWDGITGCFLKSFPDKIFSVAIIASTNPFPPIAEDGSVIKDTIPNQNLPLLALGSKKLPGHLVIQNNSLYPNVPAQTETIQSAESLKTMIAFQTNEEIKGQGAACGGRGDTTPCSDSSYLAELQTGIYPLGRNNPLRAAYIEVFALNVNAFPAVILQAHNELMAGTPTSVTAQEHASPISFDLEQNYPNPFNPKTVIRSQLPVASDVRLVIYDVLGREVTVLASERRAAGTYQDTFDGTGLASGVYVCRLQAGSFVASRTMLLMK